MRTSVLLLAWAALATAKTDLSGCTSSDVVAYGGASVLWYVPGTGEICSFLDCGGGAGAPLTTVPGCPLYSGTATYSPSFLPGFKDGSAAASSTSFVAAATTTSPSTAMITGSSTSEGVASQTSLSDVSSSSASSLGSVSTEVVTSTGTGVGIESQSTSAATESSSATTSSSSTGSESGSSTSSAASSSNTPNAGTSTSVHLLAHGIIGAIAAGVAFLL